jgi:phasin family protein
MSDTQRLNDDVQRASKNGFDAAARSFGEANRGFQAIAAEITAYSKQTFEDGTRAFQQLLAAKSLPQVIEIQSQYARMAYEAYVAELSKLGEMYVGFTRNAYKPVQQAAAEAGVPSRVRSG